MSNARDDSNAQVPSGASGAETSEQDIAKLRIQIHQEQHRTTLFAIPQIEELH